MLTQKSTFLRKRAFSAGVVGNDTTDAALAVEACAEPSVASVESGVSTNKDATATDLRAFITVSNHYGFSAWQGKARFLFLPLLLSFPFAFTGCTPVSSQTTPAIRVLLDRPPITLNPRMSADLNGQRLGELLFASLTIKDAEMRPQPYLAESWSVQDQGKKWVFKIRRGQKDHSGQEITPQRLASCFEEYRSGTPRSILMSSFRSLKSIEAKGSELVFELTQPDPYLATNLTLYRYFTTGDPSKPCREPKAQDTIVASGDYRLPRFQFQDLNPEHSVDLIPIDASKRALKISWALDENTKALQLIRGEVDVATTSLSLSKTRWIEKKYPQRFKVIERSNGVNVSYLLFNFKNPYLNKLEVRKAIALAINRNEYVRHKLFGLGDIAGSLLSPALEESAPQSFEYDPKKAEALLEQAGYPRGPDGIRLKLRYKTTAVRDGFEIALFLQNSLRRIGIELTLDVVEPAVYFASIRKGAFDLCSSRWIGVSDASILQRTLITGNPDNRGGYSSPETDALLQEALLQPDPAQRRAILAKVQAKVAQDLPFLPLWYWNPSVIIRKDLTGLESSDLSLSGSLAPLSRLR
jgi:peptide/nickel transport system substrate-binding protein